MIKLKELLIESFEGNQSLIEKLKKYESDSDIFVSYRDTPQLGINPRPEYNTPVGLYAYPIKYLLQLLTNNKFSFALNKFYVYVIKFNSDILDISKLDTNIVLAESLFNKIVEKHFLQKEDCLTNEEYSNIFNVLKSLSSSKADNKNNGFNLNSINFQSSKGKNVSEIATKIMNKLLIQDIFNLKPLINAEISFSNIEFSELNIEETLREKLVKNYLFLQKMDDYINKTKHPEKLGFLFWNITRILSGKDKNKWSTFFMNLGIYGVIDSGAGIIHPAEPCQVVFFSKKFIQTIELISNAT